MNPMDLSISNITFYSCIFVAALFMAADQALKDSETIGRLVAAHFTSQTWTRLRYGPLLLLIVAGAIFVKKAVISPTLHDKTLAVSAPIQLPVPQVSGVPSQPIRSDHDDRRLGYKNDSFIRDLETFAKQRGYRSKKVAVFCLDGDQKSCNIAKDYFNALGVAAGWTPVVGGAIPFSPIQPWAHGVNVATMRRDQKVEDFHAEVSSPFGLWRELTLLHVACAGWYIWPPVFKDLPPNTFALIVGQEWPYIQCPH